METFDIVVLAVLVPLTIGAGILLYLVRHQPAAIAGALPVLGFLIWVDVYWLFWKSGVPTSDLPDPPGVGNR